MSAIGFGEKVTGGSDGEIIMVTDGGGGDGEGTLAAALKVVNELAVANDTLPGPIPPKRIMFTPGLVIEPRATPFTVAGFNLTIDGTGGAKIQAGQLHIICSTADNIIVQNLVFEGTSGSDAQPRDAIFIDAILGRHATGVWINQCRFEAYYDLNITAKAADFPLPPLLLTISHCQFNNDHPNGDDHMNNGAIGIAGYTDKRGNANQNTNAYATVCNNVFTTVRRRSPRSSGLSVVHAFNNILDRYGAKKPKPQRNGMESGGNGRLVAEANSFTADQLTQTIDVGPGAMLQLHDDNTTLTNRYLNGAVAATTVGSIDINAAYATAGVTAPTPLAIDDALEATIRAAAGPK